MWKNTLKTACLMAMLAGLMMAIGSLIGGSAGLTTAFIMALVMNGIMYFWSDRIVLRIYNAEPMNEATYPDVTAMVHDLCISMRLPFPKLWIIKTPTANAFATGRNPHHSSVAFTTGILELLEPHELRGVIAHELSHILNRDILITTIAATFATTIGYMANMLQHIIIFGTSTAARNRHAGNTAGALLIAIFMPIITALVRLSISRSREYLADECGAHACHDPLALASALQKLHSASQEATFTARNPMHQATSSLFIVHPFSAGALGELLSTHPPLKKRISALHEIHRTMHQWPR
jgi:heat shock protein HtpX